MRCITDRDTVTWTGEQARLLGGSLARFPLALFIIGIRGRKAAMRRAIVESKFAQKCDTT